MTRNNPRNESAPRPDAPGTGNEASPTPDGNGRGGHNGPGKQTKLKIIAAVLAALLVAGSGYYWWSRDRISIDDAFVDGDIYPITPPVGGYVVEVLLKDNQEVQKGETLALLDPTDHYSWRWIFYINLPIGVLAVLMILSFVFDPPYQQRWEKGMKVDYLGLALLTVGLGCLQIVLDKGQLEDWFNSSYILWLSGVAGVCQLGLVFWELRQENPILDLRIFGDRSFATGNILIFLGFFAFFGSIVLLPLYPQTLMGYTAFLAGVVLGPGGILTLLMLPLAGKLTQRFDARYLLGFGILVNAYSVHYMSGFNLNIDLATAITGRVIQGIGMPFFFVTISYVTLAYVPNLQMNNASAIFNLLRNLGGSFGVAFVTTMLARRAQFHQARLVEHLSPYDPSLQIWLENIKDSLTHQLGSIGDQTQRALAVIYGQIQKQATAMAFDDVFHAQTIIFLSLVCILWIMKKPPMGRRPTPGGH